LVVGVVAVAATGPLDVLDGGASYFIGGSRLSPGDFRRVVCLNKLPPDRFGDLRRTL